MPRQELSLVLPTLPSTSSTHEEVRLAGLDPVNSRDLRPRDDLRLATAAQVAAGLSSTNMLFSINILFSTNILFPTNILSYP